MVSFWVNRAGSGGIRRYRESRARGIADRIQPIMYDDIGPVVRLSPGPQIFAAIDQLTPAQRRVAADIHDRHAYAFPSAIRLNDPRRVSLRFELLHRLHAEGINSFAVYPAREFEAVRRFPVFVREVTRHNGPRTSLLESRRAIERALLGLKLRGHLMRDLMIVEFCDTSDSDGLFRKYAAYRIGNAILPCHLLRSRRWWAKSSSNLPNEEGIREETEYVRSNPHLDWLRRVFDVAQIEYGRVDYGLRHGVPQAWEINLNPTLGSGSYGTRHASLGPELKQLREECRVTFHQRLQAAFVAVDGSADASSIDVSVERGLLNQIHIELTRQQRRTHLMRWLRALPDALRLGGPLRAAYYRFFPRR
jgi:hypothetical protein